MHPAVISNRVSVHNRRGVVGRDVWAMAWVVLVLHESVYTAMAGGSAVHVCVEFGVELLCGLGFVRDASIVALGPGGGAVVAATGALGAAAGPAAATAAVLVGKDEAVVSAAAALHLEYFRGDRGAGIVCLEVVVLGDKLLHLGHCVELEDTVAALTGVVHLEVQRLVELVHPVLDGVVGGVHWDPVDADSVSGRRPGLLDEVGLQCVSVVSVAVALGRRSAGSTQCVSKGEWFALVIRYFNILLRGDGARFFPAGQGLLAVRRLSSLCRQLAPPRQSPG